MTQKLACTNSDLPSRASTRFSARFLARCTDWADARPLVSACVPAQALRILDSTWTFVMDCQGKQQRPDGRPFATHLAETVEILIAGSDCVSTDSLVVALLHDVVEDTPVTVDDIHMYYGSKISAAVALLTIPPPEPGEQREIIRAAAFARLHTAPRSVQHIKLADRLSTVQNIDNHPQLTKQVQRYRETVAHILPLAARFPWFAEQFALWRNVYRHLDQSPMSSE
jgi:(p)ppGpp synthase/HD superfamily hydrolase